MDLGRPAATEVARSRRGPTGRLPAVAEEIRRPATTAAGAADAAATSLPARRTAWVREILIVIGFYNVYQVVLGQADVGARARAFRHARWIVEAQQSVGLFVEQAMQSAILGTEWLVSAANTYYGTVHFAATGGILIWLFFRRHHHYRRRRNTLALMTLLGLLAFLAFPLAPPRMLPCNESVPVVGSGSVALGECFVDTLKTAGGVWSYESPVAKAIANQFAAMPSLHFGWSLWCAAALWTHARRRVVRVLGPTHVVLTLLVIVVTANHYLLDAVGGAAVFGLAMWIATRIERRSGAASQQSASHTAID